MLSLVVGAAAPVVAQTPGDDAGDEPTDDAGEDAGDEPSEEAIAEARMHFDLAQRYYQTGRFEEAAVEFEASYALTHFPELLYNQFLAHRDAGHFDAAIAALEAYIPFVENEATRRSHEARLERMRAIRDGLRQPEDEPEGAEEEGASSAVAPEWHGVEAAPAPSRDGGDDLSFLPWTLVGVGAASLITGAILAGMAFGESAALDDMCGATSCAAGYRETQDRGYAFALGADILVIGGAVLVAGGLVWAIVADAMGEESPAIAAGCGAEGCGVALTGSFE